MIGIVLATIDIKDGQLDFYCPSALKQIESDCFIGVHIVLERLVIFSVSESVPSKPTPLNRNFPKEKRIVSCRHNFANFVQ